LEEILRNCVIPMRRQMARNFMLMQDNARSHMARITAQFLEDNNIQVLSHPPMSPDLNPIEHVWDMCWEEGFAIWRDQQISSNWKQLCVKYGTKFHKKDCELVSICTNVYKR